MPQRQNNGRNRSAIAITGCALGLALIVVGFGVGSSSKHEPASAPKEEMPVKKKLPAWNLALGDVVIVARDLGFSVSPSHETAGEAKVLARIDGQLQSMRELYRRESEKDQSLLGGILLQLTTNGAGEVTNVKELNSRIISSDFRKSIVTEAAKWTFEDVLAEPSVIKCPLLFVREGMDVTTLVNWERFLGDFGELPVLGKSDNAAQKFDRSGVLETVKPAGAGKGSASLTAVTSRGATATTSGSAYQIKYATTIRKEPSFSSTAVAKFPVGTKVVLIGKAGDWLKVSYADGGPVGFLRKEFVVPVTLAKQ
jgi:Bacterial SH3 domain